MREMVAAGHTPEEAAEQFPEYPTDLAVKAASRMTVPNEIREEAFWAMLAGEFYDEIAERLGLELNQLKWVEHFYLAPEVRARVEIMERNGFKESWIYKALSDDNLVITRSSVNAAVKVAKWNRLRAERRTAARTKKMGARGYHANRKQRLAVDPNATMHAPNHSMDKAPDFCAFEDFQRKLQQQRQIAAGAFKR